MASIARCKVCQEKTVWKLNPVYGRSEEYNLDRTVLHRSTCSNLKPCANCGARYGPRVSPTGLQPAKYRFSRSKYCSEACEAEACGFRAGAPVKPAPAAGPNYRAEHRHPRLGELICP